MKKLLPLFITALTVFFASCEKANVDDYTPITPQQSKPVLKKSSFFINQTVMADAPVIIGPFEYTVHDVDNFTAGLDLYMGGTLGLNNMTNVSYIIKKKSDTSQVVYQPTPRSVATAFFSYPFVPDNKLMKNTAYYIYVKLTPKTGTTGTIDVSIALEALWGTDGYDMSQTESGLTTMVFAYKASPVFTKVEIDDRVDTSRIKEFYKVHAEVIGISDTCTIPQLTFGVSFDNPPLDTVVKFPTLWKDGVDITNQGVWINSSGAVTTVIRKTDTKMHFRFTNSTKEDILISAADYSFGGKKMSIEPMETKLLGKPNIPAANRFLNEGTSGNALKLGTSATPSGSALEVNTIYSWKGPNHTGVVAFNKGDFVSLNTDLPGHVMSRRQ